MKQVTCGTKDYYFDMADKLEELKDTYFLITLHPDKKGAFFISNITDKDDAQNCLNHICDNFLARGLIPNPDEDDADEDSTDPAI